MAIGPWHLCILGCSTIWKKGNAHPVERPGTQPGLRTNLVEFIRRIGQDGYGRNAQQYAKHRLAHA
jgi:hypothetical protein